MEDMRHIQNPFEKIFSLIKVDRNKLNSLMLNLIQEFLKGVPLPTLLAIASVPEKTQEDISAYSGASGYLYTLIRLYRYFSKPQDSVLDYASKSGVYTDSISNQLTDPDFYLKTAVAQYELLENYVTKRKDKQQRCFSFFISEVSIWVCGMHLGHDLKNIGLFTRSYERIQQCFEKINEHDPATQWELLYGIPGFLYAVLELQDQYDRAADPQFRTELAPMVIKLTHLIVKEGIRSYERKAKIEVNPGSLPGDFRLRYSFHKKEYLGGAHGLGGNLNIILRAMESVDFKEDKLVLLPYLHASVQFLKKQLKTGNFSTSVNSQRINLVHFCHGAPGIVSCFARFANMFPELSLQMRLHETIEANLNHIWKYGVLKKGFGLCHGISGNAYVFLSPALHSLFPERVEMFRKQAELLAILREEANVMKEIKKFNFEDRYRTGVSDNPFSLMLGIAGDICFTIDAMEGVGRFPGFDF